MNPIYFSVIVYAYYAICIYLIAFPFKSRRDYWYALLGVSLAFPLEWFAAHHTYLLTYDNSYIMAFDHIPLWMFCATGGFYGFPIVVCMYFQKRIDSRPLWQSIIGLYVIFWIWDFAAEYSSTAYRFFVYYWPKEWMIGGVLPWVIPCTVAVTSVSLYYAHKFLLGYSTDKHWIHGLLIHTFGYYVVIGFLLVLSFMVFRGFLGMNPTVDYSDLIRW